MSKIFRIWKAWVSDAYHDGFNPPDATLAAWYDALNPIPLSDGSIFRHYADVKTGYLYACKRDYFKLERHDKRMNVYYAKEYGMSLESYWDRKRKEFKESLQKKHNKGLSE